MNDNVRRCHFAAAGSSSAFNY